MRLVSATYLKRTAVQVDPLLEYNDSDHAESDVFQSKEIFVPCPMFTINKYPCLKKALYTHITN